MRPAPPTSGACRTLAAAALLAAVGAAAASAQDRYAAHRSGTTTEGCLPAADVAAMRAVAQTRRWRTDASGRLSLDECVPDPAAGSAPLSAISRGCGVVGDPETWTARQTVRLVYRDGLGREAEAVPCSLRPESPVYPLVPLGQGCPGAHSFDLGGRSGFSDLQTAVFFRDDEGRVRRLLNCTSARTTRMQHDVVACPPFQRRWAQVRADLLAPETRTDGWVVPAQRIPLLGCQPAPEANPGLVGIPGRCADRVFHNAAARISFRGREVGIPRLDGEGRLVGVEPIADCVPDPATAVSHDVRTVGWEHDDAARASWPVVQHSARWAVEQAGGDREGDPRDAAGRGPLDVDVGPPERFDPPVPYVVARIRFAEAGVASFGCARWRVHDRVDDHLRPADGSETTLFHGPGTVERLDACTPRWPRDVARHRRDLEAAATFNTSMDGILEAQRAAGAPPVPASGRAP